MLEWRKVLRLNRCAFSVLLKLGSERVASYESGRAPWPDKIYAQSIAIIEQDAKRLRDEVAKMLNS